VLNKTSQQDKHAFLLVHATYNIIPDTIPLPGRVPRPRCCCGLSLRLAIYHNYAIPPAFSPAVNYLVAANSSYPSSTSTCTTPWDVCTPIPDRLAINPSTQAAMQCVLPAPLDPSRPGGVTLYDCASYTSPAPQVGGLGPSGLCSHYIK
jgi:hypothetical protein